jgi:GNAT superfamily N-acetyltransferase
MEIKSYKKGDETEILTLFKLAFGKEMSLGYWNWRFGNNPFCDQIYIELMWDGSKLIGHYAVSPIEMIIDNKILKTALSMTTMTHPEYGGKGIFSKLAKSLYDKLLDNGYHMVWGFPNNNSHYGFNKNLDWKDIAVQGIMSLKSEHFERHINLNVSFKKISGFTNAIANDLKSSTKAVKINKTLAYLDWRYIQNPTADYQVIQLGETKGLVIYKTIQSFTDPLKLEVDILDFYYNGDLRQLNELFSAIALSEKEIIQFNLWDSLFSKNQINLEKLGFRNGAPITYLGYRSLNYLEGIEDKYKNWEINLSYSDVF